MEIMQPSSSVWATFDRNQHFTVGEGDLQEPYRRRSGEEKETIKWGQLKLLNAEVQFLTLYWNPAKVPRPAIVYAGAAEGTHLAVLARLFPTAIFDLYDQRPFDAVLKEEKNIRLHQRLF